MRTRIPARPTGTMPWIALAACCIAGGWFAHAALDTHAARAPAQLGYYGDERRQKRNVEAVSSGIELAAFELVIAPEDLAMLAKQRDVALARRILLDDDAQRVPARIEFEGQTAAVHVALKGDMADHLDTEQWSLRVELEGDSFWRGMSAFSIQHPKTRALSAEWLVLEAARLRGLLTPRIGLVDVAINGERKGTYVFEEHFTRELLESQGRRDGPIVRFDESTLWSMRLDMHGAGPRTLTARAYSPSGAQVDAFGAARLAKLEELQRAWQASVERMRQLRDGTDSQRAPGAPSFEALRAASIDALIDVDVTARAHALLAFFGCPHGLYWPNLRFYGNPLTDRLEPVLYDVGARNGEVDPYEIADAPYRDFMASPRYARAMFEQLAELARADYVDGLQDALGAEYERLTQALEERGYGAGRRSSAKLWDDLRERQIAVGELIRPRDPVSWSCTVAADQNEPLCFAIEAWCTTRVPVVIESFTGLGDEVSAASIVEPEFARELGFDGAVMLPGDGRHVRFELCMPSRGDAELAALLGAIELGKAKGANVVYARYHVAGELTSVAEKLVPRRVETRLDIASGRPTAPALDEVLAQHACLAYDVARDRLYVRAGTWTVEGDLALPQGRALEIEAGTTLRFGVGAVLSASGALSFAGDDEHPIVLEPVDAELGWSGVVVFGAAQTSQWKRVVVRGTRSIDRGAWRTSGGVTFHASAAELHFCRMEDAQCEDALNVVRAAVVVEDTTFERCSGDAFDGDCISGTVSRCTFRTIGGDALDLSGAHLRIATCTINDIGDKGISIGEASQVELHACEIRRAHLGIACKDASRVEGDDIVVGRVARCALAAYVKKPQYGPCSMRLTHVICERFNGPEALAAPECQLVVDGVEVPTEDLDVTDL